MRAQSLAIRPWQCHGRDWRKCGGIARPAERASEGVAHRSSRGWQVEGQNDPLHARAHPPTNCEVAFNCFYSRIASVTSPTTPGMDLSHPGHLNNPHRVTYKTVPQLCVDAPGTPTRRPRPAHRALCCARARVRLRPLPLLLLAACLLLLWLRCLALPARCALTAARSCPLPSTTTRSPPLARAAPSRVARSRS